MRRRAMSVDESFLLYRLQDDLVYTFSKQPGKGQVTALYNTVSSHGSTRYTGNKGTDQGTVQ